MLVFVLKGNFVASSLRREWQVGFILSELDATAARCATAVLKLDATFRAADDAVSFVQSGGPRRRKGFCWLLVADLLVRAWRKRPSIFACSFC